MMNGMNQAWGMGLSWLIGLIALAVIVWLVIRVINQKNSLNQRITKSPLDVLKRDMSEVKLVKRNLLKEGVLFYKFNGLLPLFQHENYYFRR